MIKQRLLLTRVLLPGFAVLCIGGVLFADSDGTAEADKPRKGAWLPPEEDQSAYRDIVDFNIFRSDRSKLAAQVERDRNPVEPVERVEPTEEVKETPPPPADPDAAWRLTGISHDKSGAVAYIENTQTGELSQIEGAAEVSRGKVTAISYDRVVYLVGGEQRVVRVGETLAGTRVALPGATTSRPSSDGSTSRPTSLEERIRALREQRARELGEAPPAEPAESSPPDSAPEPEAAQGNTATTTQTLTTPAGDADNE